MVHSKFFTQCFHLCIFSGLIANSLILSLISLVESSLLLKLSTELLNSVVRFSSQTFFLLILVLWWNLINSWFYYAWIFPRYILPNPVKVCQVCQNVCQASQSPIKLLNAFKFKLPPSGLSISWLHHFYVSTLWNGMEMETMTVFIFLGSKITADGDCSHEIKKTLAPWKKSYDQPSILKKAVTLTLATKVHLAKAMVFPEVIYGCASWTTKKAEMLLNCGVEEDSWESLGLQGDQT